MYDKRALFDGQGIKLPHIPAVFPIVSLRFSRKQLGGQGTEGPCVGLIDTLRFQRISLNGQGAKGPRVPAMSTIDS